MATETEWFIFNRDKTYGPFTSAQLKELAATGKIKTDTSIRMGFDGKWMPAEKVKGLFDSPSRAVALNPPAVRPAVSAIAIPAPPAINRLCPFCAEPISPNAVKCKHCSEFLDGRPKLQQSVAAPVKVVVSGPLWSPGVAAVFSFLIPGLGQMYKGQIFTGLAWLLFTVIGYFACLIPGVILHLLCMIDAASGDPYR